MLSKKLAALILHGIVFTLAGYGQTFQYLTIDSALFANSEQMGFDNNGKTDGIRLIVLGPYKVGYIEKLDSGAYRTKTKEGKEMSFGSDNGYEEFKTRIFESHAYYRMVLGRESDSTASFFSYFSSYRKKTETVLSAILSKKEETSGAEYSDQNKLLQGTIRVMDDEQEWRFFLNYPPGNSGNINNSVTGFLSNGRDSLQLGYIYSDILKRNKKDPSDEKIMMRSIRGYSLVDFDNRQVAALVFRQNMGYIGAKKLANYTGGELALIGRDNSKQTCLAIATLFAIMLGIQ